MSIKAHCSPDTTRRTFTFGLEDLGCSSWEEWKSLDHSSQKERIDSALEDITEQPFWTLDSFESD